MDTSWKTRITFKQILPFLGYIAIAAGLQKIPDLLTDNILLIFGPVIVSWAFFGLAVKSLIKNIKGEKNTEV